MKVCDWSFNFFSWDLGFEDSITKQRTLSEEAIEESEKLQNKKLESLNTELEEAQARVSSLTDELDQKQVQEGVILFRLNRDSFC